MFHISGLLNEEKVNIQDIRVDIKSALSRKDSNFSVRTIVHIYRFFKRWIELLWDNDIKTRSIHVKFIFNYMNKDYGLIQHYYNNVLVGMERMNYVVDYIASNRTDPSETTE